MPITAGKAPAKMTAIVSPGLDNPLARLPLRCFCRRFVRLAWLIVLAHCSTTAAASTEPEIDESERQHWSFRPIESPSVPTDAPDGTSLNPIDAFISARLSVQGLRRSPPADVYHLIRRLSFDLIGLPPDHDTVAQFATTTEPDSYERTVDKLLASPRHGERWAQMWLDLARFAETDGFEHDKVRSQSWKYRDWVVRALNQDLPYDQFVRAQLAGDFTVASDVATAFCLSGPDMPDINSQEERRHNLLNEMTATVGSVFVGLQLGCAQCHDHKYDPISQADFYRLRAAFEPSVSVTRNKPVFTLAENVSYSQSSHVMIRGDWRRPGQPIRFAVPRIGATRTRSDTRYREQLADWLCDDDNPLTRRVITNRLWQHHFGRGLSHTPSDFGTMGDPPSHPKLLDWLARELSRTGWSLKRLHRLIVCSATYGQTSLVGGTGSSAATSANWQRAHRLDPDNRLFSRFTRRRLEGEAIRDAMLAASDGLNLRVGGPGVRPPLPEELAATLLKNQWNVTSEVEQHQRRSIYIFARRNLRYPVLDAFDRPDANASCAQRGRSTTATQSLFLMNSAESIAMARGLARYVLARAANNEQTIKMVYTRLFSRPPTQEEMQSAREFLTSEDGAEKFEQRLVELCLALFNCNEYVYLD